MSIGHAVFNTQIMHHQAVKSSADIGVVVDADHHLPFSLAHCLGHLLVLLPFERYAVAFGLLIRRIEVEEGVRPVIAAHNLLPGQVLDSGSR